jgi:DNA modification methylase
MSAFREVKQRIDLNIEDKLLAAILFEMSKFYDKEFIKAIRKKQKEEKIVIDSPNRKILRKKYYYGNFFDIKSPFSIEQLSYDNVSDDIEEISKDCLKRLNTYNPEKIIQSMKQRLEDLQDSTKSDSHAKKWLEQYDKKRKNTPYSMLIFRLNQKIFEKNSYNEEILFDFIKRTYNSLENYRYMSLIIEGEIFNKKNECITWNLLYKAGIYAENFVSFKDKFFPFHKEKQIDSLSAFLSSRNIKNSVDLSKQFYKTISTGYKFEDCYISDNQDCKILLFKKIALDKNPVPCPSCNTTITRGNSYPEMFLKSWECANPSCPDRSKSGRGKRFDEYGVYRYFKLVEGLPENKIGSDLYQNWHRDVFNHTLDYREFLIKEYTFANEKIYCENINFQNQYSRIIQQKNRLKETNTDIFHDTYDDLPIVKFFKNVSLGYHFTERQTITLKNNIEIINDDSSKYLQKLKENQINAAITSPPYYNAREYSQWQNMLMYFIDMLVNCKSVYSVLKKDSYYLYNIGDIVAEDNVYVVSNMSKRRVQLGFLSCMIFEIAGYTLTGNIIWDKGEVQSKRNSTVNLASGYVKCVNCYEHIFVFKKGKFEKISNKVLRLAPVIKINSKGENTYKHTAPYPQDLVELIRPYIKNDGYILDPFLGSGTTLKWCKQNDFKGIGIEMNKEYYNLCKSNVFQKD